MAQQYIDFGTFPNDPSADPIRAAFQKIQNNFTELYTAQVTAGVLELTTGPGLTQNRTTGNIYVYANIPNITVKTSNSLLVGISVPTGNSATISSYSTPFSLDLAPTITTANANITNLVTAGNLSVTTNVTSNLVPNANVTYNLGAPSLRWSTFYGNVLSLGSQTVSANAAGVITGNLYVTSNITVGNISTTSSITAGNISTTGTFVATGNITGGNIITGGLISATGNISGANITASANLLVSGNANIVGNTVHTGLTSLVGNVTASANVSVTGKTSTGNLGVSGYVNTDLIPEGDELRSLGNATHRWKDLYLSGNTAKIGSTTLSATDEALVIAPSVVTGNLDVGNVTAVYVAGTLTTTDQPNVTSVGTLGNLNISGNLLSGNLQVTGNVQAPNITTNIITATTISGNVVVPPGANLAAPGSNTQIMFNDGGNSAAVPGLTFNKSTNLLTIQGNVSGGNLITSGAVSGSTGTFGSLSTNNGTISAGTGNISGGNLSTSGTLTAGNASITGNLGLANLNATGSVQAGGVLSLGIVSATSGATTGANLSIASISGTGSPTNLVTVTFTAPTSAVPFPTGTKILITDVTPSGYNGEYTVVTGLLNSVTYTNSTSDTASGGRIKGGGNTTVNGFMSVEGNISAGNITTTSVTGQLVSVSGNISGANLVASGILKVDGNANVGNLTTSGLVSAATLNATSAALGSMTGSSLAATGNISGGNISTTGSLTAGDATIANLNLQTVAASGGISGLSLSVGPNLAISSINGSGSTVTVTFASQATVPFTTGTTIFITGVGTTTAYNGTYVVATASTSQVTYASTVTGTGVVTSARIYSRAGTLNAGVATLGATTADSLALNGTITGATSITSGLINATGNITGGNISSSGALTLLGTATVGNLTTNNSLNIQNAATVASTLTVGANLAISSISGDGSTITLTYAAQTTAPFPVGATVIVSGVSPTGYNGSYTVASGNTTQITYSGTTVAAATVTGARVKTGGTGLNITANASLSNMSIAAGAIISALNATANIGTVNSTILSVTGTANAGNLETGGTLSVTGAATTGQITANGAIAANGSLTVNQTANITGYVGVGANIAIASITPSAPSLGQVTITFAAQANAPFLVGSSVNLINNIPVGYNGTWTVVSGNTTQVVVTSSATGTATALGRIRTGGTALNIEGNANVTNLNAASFTTTDAALTNLTFATSGILSLTNGTANIGTANITTINGTSSDLSGNSAAGNLISRGFLQVDGNATMTSVTIANSISTSVVNVGANIALTSISGNGSTVTATFASQTLPPFPAGSTVVVTGVSPAQYNITYTVQTCTKTQATFTSTVTGAYVSGGYIRTGGTGMILQSTANLLGGLNTVGGAINAGSGNITGGTFSASLFSGNGANITNINSMNAGVVLPVTATAGTGTVATLTYDTTSFVPFQVGQTITVAGLVPAGYNGTWTVLTATTTQVTYSCTATGGMTTSGTITGAARAATAVTSDTVTNPIQTNITQVGILSGLTLNGALSGVNVSTTGYTFASVNGGVAAAGTTQGAATLLSKQVNVVTSATASTAVGILLPAGTPGMQLIIINATAVTLSVFPNTGSKIDALATNGAYSLGPNARLLIICSGTAQWYTMAGIYG